MPILGIPSETEPLSQGDLLHGVVLYESGDNKPRQLMKSDYALVISRDCVAFNKDRVIVAPVEKMALDLEKIHGDIKDLKYKAEKQYKQTRSLLEGMRDGGERPDRLYLGPWGEQSIRIEAHLDKLCSLVVPEVQEERQLWVRTHRIARLAEDFLRALPVRMFWAFGRVGFDDTGWYHTQDLRLLISFGEAYLHQLQSVQSTAEAEFNARSSGDLTRDSKLTQARDKAAKDVADLEQQLERYKTELSRRK